MCFNIKMAASIFRWLMIQHTTSSHTTGFLSVARGDAHGSKGSRHRPAIWPCFSKTTHGFE